MALVDERARGMWRSRVWAVVIALCGAFWVSVLVGLGL